MNKSIFLRRIITLLAASLILSCLLTSVVYSFIIKNIYVRIQSKEMMSISRAVAQVLSTDDAESLSHRNPLLSPENRIFLGSRLHIYNAQGDPVTIQTEPPEPNKPSDCPSRDGNQIYFNYRSTVPREDLSPITQPILEKTLSGRESLELNGVVNGKRYMAGGVPILNNDDQVIGAVLFTKKVSDLTQALTSLRISLFLSGLLTFLIMLPAGFFVAKRLTAPLLQMRNVSLNMAKGDFSVRADESQKGEIGQLAASINRFAEESQRLEKTRQDYVSNVSHELRTPVAAIRAMGETLSDGMIVDDEKKQRYYQNILRESMRLSRLVDDLLELSRIQSGAVALQKTAFHLQETLQNCVDIYGTMASEIGVRLELDGDLNGLAPVYSNSDRIEQVLIILLDNALKHTPEDGRVVIGTKDTGDAVTVTVSDSGDGIPPEDLPYVFERFYKVDKSHSSGGTGLGLSIARELLTLLGETISVTSKPGGGATFTFTVQKNV